MDSLSDLKSRIQEVADRVSLGKNSDAAETHRLVSSSIGSETPLGVLTEIREGQSRLLQELKALAEIQRETEARREERHREVCTILLGIAEPSRTYASEGTRASNVPHQSVSLGSDGKSFYGSHSIANGTYLVACILMHMDSMLQAHPKFKKIQTSDSTFLDVKDWYTMCGSALNADKNSKAGLRVPKPVDEDFRAACRVVASPVRGRRPTCDSSHIPLLLAGCPAIMTTVEWTRVALLRCAGVLSPERTCRFRLFKHPFVNDVSELLVEDTSTLKLPNRWMHQDVLNMKSTVRKEYMRLVLEESLKPMDAIGMVKVKLQKNKVI
jgi:hypothetical protein